VAFWLGVVFAVTFALTNGFHDAANAVATLVATRGLRPRAAIALSAAFNMLGALVVGTAVANTVAGIVLVDGRAAVRVVGSAALGAVVWNVVTWWRAIPSSSGHALVGGLVGAALTHGGGAAVHWGGFEGGRPRGVFAILLALAVSPVAGVVLGFALVRLGRRLLRRATRAVAGGIRVGQWGMTAALSFSHGANNAQQAMGLVAALLLASGRATHFGVPLWAAVACGAALTLGTSLGGWRIVRTIGRRIFPLAQLDALASQSGSAAVILTASYLGAPVSTTQVVASSVVGAGGGRRRWRHVRWRLVLSILFAWLLTLPAAGALSAGTYLVWSAFA